MLYSFSRTHACQWLLPLATHDSSLHAAHIICRFSGGLAVCVRVCVCDLLWQNNKNRKEKSHLMLWIGKETPKDTYVCTHKHGPMLDISERQANTNATTFDKFGGVVIHWCPGTCSARFTHMVYWVRRRRSRRAKKRL